MAAHVSFLKHNDYRWLKLSILLIAVVIGGYFAYDPNGNTDGGTALGYTLGGLGALIIVWLAWMGVKKRSFSAGDYRMRAWTSAHVYLGLALVVIATLHSNFQFSWNVHTLGYVLVIITVLSGLFGIWAYARYPSMMTRNMGGASAEALLKEMSDLDARLARLTQQLPDEFAVAARDSLDNTRIGGGFGKLISGSSAGCGSARGRDAARRASGRLTDPGQKEAASEMVQTLERKAEIAAMLRRNLKMKAVMDVWLWVHVPMTVALLATLTAHVFIVFFYW